MIRSSNFRPDIEGLRGIAVLVIVGFHCGIPGFSGGFVGVDIFFVLSGYLITGLLVNEIQNTSRLDLCQFYARRVRRLLPAFATVTLATLIAGAIILAPHELNFAGRAARAAAIYTSNIFFALNAANYFAPDVKTNPMLHTWSLAVEEQFYLIWPVLIMLGLQWWRSRKALATLLLILTVASVTASAWFTASDDTFAFYELPTRAWEFGAGGLAALLPGGTLKLGSGCSLALGWIGILTIVASAHLISANASFPGWIASFPVLGTAAALITGAERSRAGTSVVLGSPPLQALGRLSYSWYLWHWPFLVFAAALFPSMSLPGKMVAALVALAVAAVTHKTIENPIRFHPFLIRRPLFSLCFAAALTLCSVAAAFLSMRFAVRLGNAPEMRAITAAIDDIAAMPREQCVSLGNSSEVKTCSFGEISAAMNIVLFGDSHAIQWFDPLLRIAQLHGWKLTTIVKSGCPATDFKPPDSTASFVTNCAVWRRSAIQHIGYLRPSLVFEGNATDYLGRIENRDVALKEWRDGTRRTLAALSASGLRVIEIRDVPLSPFDIPTCLARSIRHSWYPGRSCDMEKSSSLNPDVFEAERAGGAGLPNVYFIDLTDQLCHGDVCQAIHGSVIAYRDNNHLTGSFASSLASILDIDIQERLNSMLVLRSDVRSKSSRNNPLAGNVNIY